MLEGLRARTGMKLSRTGGALSMFEKPGVIKGDAPMSLTVAGLAAIDKASAVRRAREDSAQQRAAAGGFYAPNIGAIGAQFTREATNATKAARERAEHEAAAKLQTVVPMLLKNRSKGGKLSLPPLPKLGTSTFTKPLFKPTVQVPMRPTTANVSPRKLRTLVQGATGFVQQEVKARTPKKFKGPGSREKNRNQELIQQGVQMGPGKRNVLEKPN
jgi:hypothetical protein